MTFGSWLHILPILVAIGLVVGLFYLLGRCSVRTQKIVVFGLMLANVLQHLFKFAIYPHYHGDGFNIVNTAYNMCALLILLSPVVYCSRSSIWKDFALCTGMVAGFVAIAVPVWFFGKNMDELGFEYVRFCICHVLLFVSSGLALMLKHHRLSYRRFLYVGLMFLLALLIILYNNTLGIILGLAHGSTAAELYETLCRMNPCWVMMPSADDVFAPLVSLIHALSPDFLCGKNATGQYAPILWYALPVYIGISAAACLFFTVIDRKNFVSDLKAGKILGNRRKMKKSD